MIDVSKFPICKTGPTLKQALAEARKFANEHQVAMAVGWQINDDANDACKQYGWCPLHAVGNAFVVEVLHTIEPEPAKKKRARRAKGWTR